LADELRHPSAQHAQSVDIRVNCRVNEAVPLWYLGYPDQARQRIHEALALAQDETNHYSLVFALIHAAGLSQRCLQVEQTRAYAEEVVRLSVEHDLVMWKAAGDLYSGWARVAQGEIQQGLAQVEQSLASTRSTGLHHVRYAAILAEAYVRAGHLAEAQELMERLVATIATTDEREWEAELYRLEGELYLIRDPNSVTQAMACFHKAIDTAQAQQAKSLELRATLSLSRLWKRQGKRTEAYALLAALYGWFTEGLDSPDLQEAQSLLVLLG
jgi:predicted ATPase